MILFIIAVVFAMILLAFGGAVESSRGLNRLEADIDRVLNAEDESGPVEAKKTNKSDG